MLPFVKNIKNGLLTKSKLLSYRKEKNTCGICWHTVLPEDFQLSGTTMDTGLGITDEDICCAYGPDGLNSEGFDCLIFPNKQFDPELGTAMEVIGLEQCGRSKGLVNVGEKTIDGATVTGAPVNINRTLCSNNK